MSDVPHSDETENETDSQLEALLKTLDSAELPLNRPKLDRIKQIGQEHFTHTHTAHESAGVDGSSELNRTSVSQTQTSSQTSSRLQTSSPQNDLGYGLNRTNIGARKMLARTFVSVSAVAILAAIVLQTSHSFASLGDSLEEVEQSETLQLEIIQDGEKADVWMTKSGDVRWQTPDKHSYVIARGARLWRIDEAANTARREENPWRDKSTKQVDVLAMIGLQKNSAKLRKARSVGREVVDGVECDVFRTVVSNGDRELLVRAFADSKTKRLRSIACWVNGPRKPVGPPIAELKLIARNVPVAEDKFVVAKTLTEDGRLGKIVDRQGIVTLRPLNSTRWTPVARSLVVKPGDWIRTSRRGANAVAVFLEAGHRLTLGPATLVEFTRFDTIKIHSGEVQVTSAKNRRRCSTCGAPTINTSNFPPTRQRCIAWLPMANFAN